MMIIMKANATPQQVEAVIARVQAEGLNVHLSQGVEATMIGAIGETHNIPLERFDSLDGVETVQRITQPYKLASRQFHPENTIQPVDGFTVGGDEIAVIAGPCSVESRSQIIETAIAVKEAGASALRGGVFKPRTSPYSFQGLGEEGNARDSVHEFVSGSNRGDIHPMSFDNRTLAKELEEALAELPMFDVHTHLVGGHLGARGLHDVLLYHMVVSDLYAAGCPSGARLTQYPGWPTREEAHQRLTEAIPYLPLIRNTSCFWGVRLILRDLYDWHEPLTLDNWQRADAMIRERADDRTWWYSVLDRLHIRRTCTESARRESGVDDARLQYSTPARATTSATTG